MALKQLRCPACRSTELVLRESTEVTSTWQDGLFLSNGYRDRRTRIVAAGEADHREGNVLRERTEIECRGCGKCWHPRREFDGPAPRKDGRG